MSRTTAGSSLLGELRRTGFSWGLCSWREAVGAAGATRDPGVGAFPSGAASLHRLSSTFVGVGS